MGLRNRRQIVRAHSANGKAMPRSFSLAAGFGVPFDTKRYNKKTEF
jgi:hypothetical protein